MRHPNPHCTAVPVGCGVGEDSGGVCRSGASAEAQRWAQVQVYPSFHGPAGWDLVCAVIGTVGAHPRPWPLTF